MKKYLILIFVILVGLSTEGQAKVTFIGIDTITQGAWKNKYGLIAVNMYPDGGTPNFPDSFARGVGTQFRWGLLSFDNRLPQRYTINNCCNPIDYIENGITKTIGTGESWPPNTRFGAGWYYRSADGVPFRFGIRIINPTCIRFYLVDYDNLSRIEQIDVYEETDIQVSEPGSLGQPYQNGELLDTRVFTNFQNGIYVGWNINVPVIFQFSTIPNENGLAVQSGIFLDPISVINTDFKIGRERIFK